MVTAKQLIAAAKRQNSIVVADIKAKLFWYYYNDSHRSEPTFEATRKAGKRWTNCMGGVSFACKEAGIPASALQWYGSKGKIIWLSDHAKADAKKYFDLLVIKKRTVAVAVKKGIIQPADILTYMDMYHTNMYVGDNESFDAGHAFCIGSGEGAKYRKWIGALTYGGHKVYCILRLKSDAKYRVQVGAYSVKENADKRAAKVLKKTGLACFVETTDQHRVYCGSFSQAKNAIQRIDDLEAAGITKAFIIEI